MNKHCYRLILAALMGYVLYRNWLKHRFRPSRRNGNRLWVTLRRTSLLLWLALGYLSHGEQHYCRVMHRKTNAGGDQYAKWTSTSQYCGTE